MGSECGIPASKAGLAVSSAAGAVKDLAAEATPRSWPRTTNKLDPLFENNDLRASGTGISEVFDTVDYDGVPVQTLLTPPLTAWSLLATPSAGLAIS